MIPSAQSANNYPTSIVLPVGPQDFAAFIRDLLGKPQSIRGRIRGVYDIDASTIVSTYHLVQQRVSQNKGDLVQFICRVIYEDGSSVILNSLEDFENYREVRPVASTQVHLSWVYLLSFPGIPQPQRQEIDVSFEASGEYAIEMPHSHEGRISHLITQRSNLGCMNWEIRHTMRTWGSDLDGMLRNLAATLQQKESPVRVWFDQYSFVLAVVIAGLFLVAASMMISHVETSFLRHY